MFIGMILLILTISNLLLFYLVNCIGNTFLEIRKNQKFLLDIVFSLEKDVDNLYTQVRKLKNG